MSATFLVESKTVERLILALLLSIGLHLALLFAIPAQPDNPRGDGPTSITATLERPPSIEVSPTASSEPEAIVPAAAETPPAPAEEISAPRQQSPAEIESPAALEIPVIRDPTYYAVSLLDEYPRPLRSVEPRYPQQASRNGITGTLNEISVVAAKPEAIFDEAAMAAFRDLRFSPARKGGRAVRSRVHITVGFEAK